MRGSGLDGFDEEDVLVLTVGHHRPARLGSTCCRRTSRSSPPSPRPSSTAGCRPCIAMVVTSPLVLLTEYLTRRWSHLPVSVMGSGTSLDTLRFTERLAQECGVHPRSVPAWVVGEHGDSSVFLHSSATMARPFPCTTRRGIDVTPGWIAGVERDVRARLPGARPRGSVVHGIGLTVSGLVRCIGRESGAPSSRCRDGSATGQLREPAAGNRARRTEASRCGRSWTRREARAWEQSLDVLRAANESLPI